MAKEQKTNLYLLSIVAIVAIVGIVVLILNSGAGSVSLSSNDLSGEATMAKLGTGGVKTLYLGTGNDVKPIILSACGDYCDICGCDDKGNNCKCQD